MMKLLKVSNVSKAVLGALVLGGLAACSAGKYEPPQTEWKAPEFEMPFPVSCAKPESAVTISAEARANVRLLEDEIEVKDTEYLNCEGKVTDRGHHRVRDFRRALELEAPTNLAQEVTAIEVENPRTCMKVQTTATSAKPRMDKVTLPDGKELDLKKFWDDEPTTSVDKTGRISLAVTDYHTQVFPSQLSLAQGANAIQIRYFGRCLEKDPKDQTKCLRAEPLGSREVLLNLKVTLRDVPGVKQVNECEKKETDNQVVDAKP